MDKHYVQFPLCLLSYEHDIPARLNGILSLAIVEMGIKQWQKFSPNERVARHSIHPRSQFCTCKIDLERRPAPGSRRLRIPQHSL
jgi:hypothetical protein